MSSIKSNPSPHQAVLKETVETINRRHFHSGDEVPVSASAHCLFKMSPKALIFFFPIYLGLWIRLPLRAYHA